MASDYWIKLYVEILDDPKMGTLPDRLWRRVIEIFLVAGKLNGEDKSGILPDTRQIAWVLRIPADDLELDLQQIAQTGILERLTNGWLVKRFKERQDAATSTERWRAHRDRKRKKEYYTNEVQTKRLTETETEADTDTDTEAEGRDDDSPRLSELSVAFVNESHIPELTGGPEKWIDALKKMQAAKVEPVDVVNAVKEMRAKQLTITCLASIVNPSIIARSKRLANGNGNGAKPQEKTWDDRATMEEFIKKNPHDPLTEKYRKMLEVAQ